MIGLGRMGRGIARNLDRTGRLAAAWDASPEALRRAGLSPKVAPAEPGSFDCSDRPSAPAACSPAVRALRLQQFARACS